MVLARLIKSFIQDPICAVLLQETQMNASDLPGFEYATLATLYGDEIYWNVTGRELANVPDDEMLRIVWGASFYPFSAFFYGKKSESDKATLAYGDLEEIVNALVAVAVGAFDADSFLVWWRDDSRRPFPLPIS